MGVLKPTRAKRWAPTNPLRKLRMAFSFDGEHPATQRQVADAIHVGLDRYFQLENSNVIPTPRERKALAAFFGVPQRDLVLPAQESRRVAVRRPVKVRRAS